MSLKTVRECVFFFSNEYSNENKRELRKDVFVGKRVSLEGFTGRKVAQGFKSVDPLAPEYPYYTPYQFAGNMPIKFIDRDGLEPAEPGSTEGEEATATVGQGQSFPIDWKWHNGSDKLGTKAGWYSKRGYNKNVVEAIANDHGNYAVAAAEGYCAGGECTPQDTEFNIGDYLNFNSSEEYFSWTNGNNSTYNEAYNKTYVGTSRRRASGGVGLTAVYPFFDILSIGSAKFWTSPLRVLSKTPTTGLIYRVQGKPFFLLDEAGNVSLNHGIYKANKGATVYLFTDKAFAMEYLEKKILKESIQQKGRTFGMLQFKVDYQAIQRLSGEAVEQSLGVKWVSYADKHVYGGAGAYGVHTDAVKEIILPMIIKESGKFKVP